MEGIVNVSFKTHLKCLENVHREFLLIPTSHAKLNQVPLGPTHWGQGPSKNGSSPEERTQNATLFY